MSCHRKPRQPPYARPFEDCTKTADQMLPHAQRVSRTSTRNMVVGWPKVDKLSPALSSFVPNRVDLGDLFPTSARFGPNSARLGSILAEFGVALGVSFRAAFRRPVWRRVILRRHPPRAGGILVQHMFCICQSVGVQAVGVLFGGKSLDLPRHGQRPQAPLARAECRRRTRRPAGSAPPSMCWRWVSEGRMLLHCGCENHRRCAC